MFDRNSSYIHTEIPSAYTVCTGYARYMRELAWLWLKCASKFWSQYCQWTCSSMIEMLRQSMSEFVQHICLVFVLFWVANWFPCAFYRCRCWNATYHCDNLNRCTTIRLAIRHHFHKKWWWFRAFDRIRWPFDSVFGNRSDPTRIRPVHCWLHLLESF